MTPRERFIAALERRPFTGPVPHFELVFFLTMEAFGRVHPSHRSYRHLGTVVVCPLTTRLHPRWRSRVQVSCDGRPAGVGARPARAARQAKMRV